MTRELKLALIVGFSLVLVVTVLISDHLSKARQVHLAEVSDQQPALVAPPLAEPGPAIPPPSDHRLAVKPEVEASQPLASAPDSTLIEIMQTRGGSATAPADPDQELIQRAQASGWDIVERDGVRDLVPRDPIAPPAPNAQSALATSPLPPPPLPERTHTVAEGDSLCKIAKQYYGDENAWKKLAAANSGITPESMKIGMKIKLPPSEQITGKPGPALAMDTPAAKSGGTPALIKTTKVNVRPEQAKNKYASYVVKKGDTVTEIARRHLGSPGRAGELLRLNESVIEDEDSLQTGMVLRLPLS